MRFVAGGAGRMRHELGGDLVQSFSQAGNWGKPHENLHAQLSESASYLCLYRAHLQTLNPDLKYVYSCKPSAGAETPSFRT